MSAQDISYGWVVGCQCCRRGPPWPQLVARKLGRFLPGAIALAPAASNGRRLVAIPLVYENKLAVVDAATGAVVTQVETGIAPFAAAIDRTGATARRAVATPTPR